MVQIHALMNIYNYVTNQQLQTHKIFYHILLFTDMFRSLLRPSPECHTKIQYTRETKMFYSCHQTQQ